MIPIIYLTNCQASQPHTRGWDGAMRVRKTLSFAKNAFVGIALRCNAFITVMQAAEVRNLGDPSDTRDLPCMWTLLIES